MVESSVVPRNTFTFSVEQALTEDIPSVRDSILLRYVMYCQGLSRASSKEIRILAATASGDVRSTTGYNCRMIEMETGLEVKTSSKQCFKNIFKKREIPVEEEWRVPLLRRLLMERRECLEAYGVSEEWDRVIDMVWTSTFS